MANVFKKYSSLYEEFKPVIDWVLDGKGKIVFGGTKYLTEIKDYLPIIKELSIINKTVKIEDDQVDDKTVWASSQIQHNNFDDQHLVGLLMVSGCRLICSLDSRAYPYFTHKLFLSQLPNGQKFTARREMQIFLRIKI